MVRNPYTQVLDLLRDEWSAENTSGFTPVFARVTDIKSIDFKKNPCYVLLGRFKPNQPTAGISYLVYHEYQMGTLDIRVYGRESEELFLLICAEAQRILEANFKLLTDPANDYDLIDIDGDIQDLSADYHDVYRMVRPVKLIKLSVQRGT